MSVEYVVKAKADAIKVKLWNKLKYREEIMNRNNGIY